LIIKDQPLKGCPTFLLTLISRDLFQSSHLNKKVQVHRHYLFYGSSLMELIACKILRYFQLFLTCHLLTSKFLCLLLKERQWSRAHHLGDDPRLLWLQVRLYFIQIYDKLQLVFLLDFANLIRLVCTLLKRHLSHFLRLHACPSAKFLDLTYLQCLKTTQFFLFKHLKTD